MPTTPLTAVRSVEELLAHLDTGLLPNTSTSGGTPRPIKTASARSASASGTRRAFTVAGETYPTAEHYMMAEKARLFGDEATRQAILRAGHPDEAKRFGRRITPFDEAQWHAARFDIVVRGNVAKFSQHPALREFLLGTGSRRAGGSQPRGCHLGHRAGRRPPEAAHPAQWRGLNLLGFALMEVREQLRDVAHVRPSV